MYMICRYHFTSIYRSGHCLALALHQWTLLRLPTRLVRQVQVRLLPLAVTSAPRLRAPSRTYPLEPLPDLANEDVPRAAGERRDPVVLVRIEHQQVATLEPVREHRAVGFWRLEFAALEICRVAQHNVHGDE